MAAPRDSLSVCLDEILAKLGPAPNPDGVGAPTLGVYDLRIMMQCQGIPIKLTDDPLGPMVWAWWEPEQRWVYSRCGNHAYLQRTESGGQFTLTLLFPDDAQDLEGYDKSRAAFDKLTAGLQLYSHNTGLWAVTPRA